MSGIENMRQPLGEIHTLPPRPTNIYIYMYIMYQRSFKTQKLWTTINSSFVRREYIINTQCIVHNVQYMYMYIKLSILCVVK